MKQTLIIGYFDRGNFGDNIMRRAVQLLLAEHQHQVDIKSSSLPSFQPESMFAALRFLRQVRIAEVVILAGGTHFHDSYGRRTPRILLTYLAIFGFARFFGTKIGLAGVGIGPIDTSFGRWAVREILRLSQAVLVRDSRSLTYVHQLSGSDKVSSGYDLATVIDIPTTKTSAKHPIIAISIVPYFSVWAQDSQADIRVIEAISNALVALHREVPGLEIRILVFCNSRHSGDKCLSENLMHLIGNSGLKVSTRECIEYDDAVREMAEVSALVAWRYHAAILGYLYRLPLAIVAYHEKCVVLAQELGLPSDALLSPNDTLDSQTIRDSLAALLEQPDKYRAPVARSMLRNETRQSFDSFLNLLVG